MSNHIRRYSELKQLTTFEERFKYLSLSGVVGQDTFGFDRYLNQQFYKSKEWKRIRDIVILRDNGCDLGIAGYEIGDRVYIHHMNPISANDIINATELLLNPEYLISVSFDTHNAIHFGDDSIIKKNVIIPRQPNDTCPWKR